MKVSTYPKLDRKSEVWIKSSHYEGKYHLVRTGEKKSACTRGKVFDFATMVNEKEGIPEGSRVCVICAGINNRGGRLDEVEPTYSDSHRLLKVGDGWSCLCGKTERWLCNDYSWQTSVMIWEARYVLHVESASKYRRKKQETG